MKMEENINRIIEYYKEINVSSILDVLSLDLDEIREKKWNPTDTKELSEIDEEVISRKKDIKNLNLLFEAIILLKLMI